MSKINNENNSFEKIKDKIIETALADIAFDGWTDEVLLKAFKRCKIKTSNYPDLFPNGILDCIVHFTNLADKKMISEYESLDISPERVTEKIKSLILLRFKYLLPYKEAVRRSIAILALPGNGHLAVKSLYQTVDEIWRTAGDKSTDFSFYSKRGTLAAVYSSTMIAWIGNNNPDITFVESFLDRRLDQVALFGKISKPIKLTINSLLNQFENIGFPDLNRNH